MSLTIIIIVLLVGLLLISMEVFLVPGTTIVGMIGLGVMAVGIYYAFNDHGITVGGTALLGAALVIGVLTTVGVKRLEKSDFNVRSSIDSKVNVFDYSGIEVGDEGVTLTALRPEGRAMIGDQRVIVYSKGFYIDTDSKIVVDRIKDNKIYVEQKS